MKQYTNYCTQEQTQRAFKLGAPMFQHVKGINWDNKKEEMLSTNTYLQYRYCRGIEEASLLKIPTTQQMMNWLKEKGIKFFGNLYINSFNVEYIDTKNEIQYKISSNVSESEAIDAALDYLEKGESV